MTLTKNNTKFINFQKFPADHPRKMCQYATLRYVLYGKVNAITRQHINHTLDRLVRHS